MNEQPSPKYESLRSRVLKGDEVPNQGNPGLALFIRQGMLAWITACHKYSSSKDSDQINKRIEAAELPYKAQPEMIKILANITLFNLKEIE